MMGEGFLHHRSCLLSDLFARVTALQSATPVLIALYDSDDRLRHANPSFRESFTLAEDDFPTWADIMRLNHRLRTGVVIRNNDFEGWLLSAQSRRGKLPYRAFEMDMYDGRWFWMTETVQQDGWMLCVASDVTELRQGYRTLRQDRDLAVRASQTDELTGTANRRFVFAKLALQVEQVSKGLEASFCLCTLDIDFSSRSMIVSVISAVTRCCAILSASPIPSSAGSIVSAGSVVKSSCSSCRERLLPRGGTLSSGCCSEFGFRDLSRIFRIFPTAARPA